MNDKKVEVSCNNFLINAFVFLVWFGMSICFLNKAEERGDQNNFWSSTFIVLMTPAIAAYTIVDKHIDTETPEETEIEQDER